VSIFYHTIEYVLMHRFTRSLVYPLMKRITYWPQAWLGVTINLGAIVAWLSVTRNASLLPMASLLVSLWSWTMLYGGYKLGSGSKEFVELNSGLRYRICLSGQERRYQDRRAVHGDPVRRLHSPTFDSFWHNLLHCPRLCRLPQQAGAGFLPHRCRRNGCSSGLATPDGRLGESGELQASVAFSHILFICSLNSCS
jgi:hypothetical protein